MKNIYISLVVIAALVVVGHLDGAASRPESSNYSTYLAQGGPIGYFNNGTAMLPNSVISGAVNGNMSTSLQFTMGMHLLNEAAEREVQAYTKSAGANSDTLFPPQRRDPFRIAQQRSFGMQCRASKVFMQAVVSMYLPMLSLKPSNGGSTSQAAQQQQAQRALTLAQSVKPSDKCQLAGIGGGGIDPQLLMAIVQGR